MLELLQDEEVTYLAVCGDRKRLGFALCPQFGQELPDEVLSAEEMLDVQACKAVYGDLLSVALLQSSKIIFGVKRRLVGQQFFAVFFLDRVFYTVNGPLRLVLALRLDEHWGLLVIGAQSARVAAQPFSRLHA